MRIESFAGIVGKTISRAVRMRDPRFDDAGWLRVEFDDGSHITIEASYLDDFTRKSMGPYPTSICVCDQWTDAALVEFDGQGCTP